MKWIGISGSWRQTTTRLEIDVKREVSQIIASGDGVVTGGALGVDFLATELVIKLDPKLRQLSVILPTKLSIFAKHYQKRADEGVISQKQAKRLINQLEMIKSTNPKALVEGPIGQQVNQSSYYARNAAVIHKADRLIAFQVNNSAGTQNAINLAKKSNKKTKIYSYITD